MEDERVYFTATPLKSTKEKIARLSKKEKITRGMVVDKAIAKIKETKDTQ